MTSTLSRRDTRNRLLDAAVRLTTEVGWSNVTMSKLADVAGVSRQTVYNEIGSKPELVQAMIVRELERFLSLVDGAFDEHPDDLVAAIRKVVCDVLTRACDNPLLVAVVSATHGADTELLPYLTTHSEWMLDGAKATLQARLVDYDLAFEPQEIEIAADILVRAVLSNIMSPSGSPDSVADGIAWMVQRLLGEPVRLPFPRSAQPDESD